MQPKSEMAPAMQEQLVIIGNGMAAQRLVKELTEKAPSRYAITVAGEEPGLAYNRVLLSSMLAREAQNHSLKEGIDFMKRLLIAFVLIGVSLLAIACGKTKTTETGKTIKSAPVGNNLTVTLSNKDGVFRHGDQDFFVSFKDSSGKLVEVAGT